MVLRCALFNIEITIITWKPHFKQTTMSWDAPGSASIMVLSFRHSEHTNHTLESTDFFTELRSTALLTCWQVNPVINNNKFTFQSRLGTNYGFWVIFFFEGRQYAQQLGQIIQGGTLAHKIIKPSSSTKYTKSTKRSLFSRNQCCVTNAVMGSGWMYTVNHFKNLANTSTKSSIVCLKYVPCFLSITKALTPFTIHFRLFQ